MEIRKLNMLRGLAALIVLVSHFSNSTNWLNTNLGDGAGQFGVMLFFMLSGFLMSYLYIDQKNNKQNIKKYTVARAARVLPLFLLLVFSSYFLQILDVKKVLYDIPDTATLISHLLLIKGNNVLWTIGTEIQFYVIFVAIWRLYAWKAGYLYILIALTLILLIFMNFPHPTGVVGGFPYDFPLFISLPYFFVGIIFGKLYTSFKVPNYMQSGWFIFALCLIPMMYPRIFLLLTGIEHEFWSDLRVLVLLSMVFFAVVFLVPDKNCLMANKVGDFLGKISYSLYLIHVPILWQLKKLEIGNTELKFLIFIFCSLVVSLISYKLIELPSSKFIRKFASNKNTPAALN